MALPLDLALQSIAHAREEDTREHAFRVYLASFPNMTEKNYITFDDYYEKTRPRKITLDARPKDEIMADILGKGG